jgi:uncharacterized paraquat-inducible protein A
MIGHSTAKIRDYYLEEVTFLRSCGVSDAEILTRLNVSPTALAKALEREGRQDLARPFWAIRRRLMAGVCADCGDTTSHPSYTRCVRCGHVARLVTRRRNEAGDAA